MRYELDQRKLRRLKFTVFYLLALLAGTGLFIGTLVAAIQWGGILGLLAYCVTCMLAAPSYFLAGKHLEHVEERERRVERELRRGY